MKTGRLNVSFAMTMLVIALAACTTTQPQPTPAPPPECSLADVLPQVDALLAGTDYQADYLTINHQLSLSIWLVDPEIDPHASAETVPDNARRALLTGTRLSHRMLSEIPCSRDLFEAVNPMIVDADFNAWYIDVTPVGVIPKQAAISDEELLNAIERTGMETAYLRRMPPSPPPILASSQTCQWAYAYPQIMALFGDDRRNIAAYLIVGYQGIPGGSGGESVYAQVQWDVRSPDEGSKEAVLERLSQLSQILSCLDPAVDRFEAYVVDAQGKVKTYALIPKEVILSGPYPLTENQFTLIFFDD